MKIVNTFICGNFTYGQRKPCKMCRHFFLWGISTGYCLRKKEDKQCHEHCKYYKREAQYWYKSGKCKVDENEMYC